MFWYLLVQRNVLRNSAFLLKSAVVRCSQCLLWNNTRLFQNDGQILRHRHTEIFDLLFQPNVVYIKQITVSGLVFKCSGRTTMKTVLLSSSCLIHLEKMNQPTRSTNNPNWTSRQLVRRHPATVQDMCGRYFSGIHGYAEVWDKRNIWTEC